MNKRKKIGYSELVVIDSDISDIHTISDALTENQTAILLSDGTGINELLAYLEKSGIVWDAMHFITHGHAGSFSLNGDTVSLKKLDADKWAQLGSYLAADGDILLYGCSVAASDDGKKLIDALATSTGADVAASDDITGMGGDWDLETQSGTIDANVLSPDNYAHSLTQIGFVKDGESLVVSNELYWRNSSDYNAGVASILTQGSLTAIECTFRENSAKMNGGAVTSNYGTFYSSNCNFTLNTAVDGGAIHCYQSCLTAFGDTFSKNVSNVDGGAVFSNFGTFTASFSTFSGNTATGKGGAVHTANDVFDVIACTFSGNTVTKYGGAIHTFGSTVTINASTFSGNIATENGGAIYQDGEKSSLTIRNCSFLTATDTICIKDGSVTFGGKISLAGNLYSKNAITVEGGTEITLDLSSHTQGNSVAIISDLDKILKPDCGVAYSVNVNENQAYGKYLLATGASARTISVVCGAETLVEAMAVGEQKHVLYTRVDWGLSRCKNLQLSLDGNSLYFTVTDVPIILSSLGEILNSIGAGETLPLSRDVSYREGDDADFNGITIDNEKGIDGAGYTIDAKQKKNLFTVKSGGHLTLKSVTLSGAVGQWGSAVRNNQGTFTATGSTFSGNTATDYGGAAYNYVNQTFTANTSTFGGNIARQGGAAYNLAGTFTATGSMFSGNTATEDGGAVFNDRGTFTANNSTFDGNIANHQGGAVYNEQGIFAATASAFSGNSATLHGGAAYNRAGTFGIKSGTFSENSAYYGGAVYNNQGTFTANNSAFGTNTADKGGAVYNSGTFTATGSTFSGNIATVSGGAIYQDGWNSSLTIRDCSFLTATDTICIDDGSAVFGGKISLAGNLYSKNAITVEDGTEITFDLNPYTAGNSIAIISDLDKILTPGCGAAYSVNVSATQACGEYLLATGATARIVSVVCDGETLVEAMDTGEAKYVPVGDEFKILHLTLKDNSLCLSVSDSASPSLTIFGAILDSIAAGKTMSLAYSFSYIESDDADFAGITVDNTKSIDGAGYTIDAKRKKNLFTVAADGCFTLDNITLSGASAEYGGAVNNGGTFTANTSTFSANSADIGGAVYISYGTAAVSGSTFTGNTANKGGAVYNGNGTLTIRDSAFTTATDTVYNKAALILGGTITTAANIFSDGRITFENDTQLVLDLSGYDEGNPTAFLSNYDTAFGNDADFSITVNVAENQAKTDYILADTAANFDKSVTITCGENSGELTLEKSIELNDRQYTLALDAEDRLVLTIATPLLAIVTAGGTTTSVTIGDTTYTGTAKKTEEIAGIAGSFKQIVMQGGRVQNLENSPVSLRNDQELIADSVIFYSNNNADGDGGALNNSGKLTVTTFSGLAHGVRASFTDNRSSYNGGAVNNKGVFSATDTLFSNNRANLNGGALYNSSGSATITGATFTGNSAASGGAVYNLNADLTLSDSVFSGNTSSGFGGALSSNNTSQSLTLENCSFLTRTDTVFANGGTITLGGVIVTAAELNFGGAITIKPDTEILLDLSCYSGTELTSGLLANYDASFAPQQDNLTISVNAASLTQKQGNYVIASQVGDLGFKESISVCATGSDESLFSVALGGTTLYNGRSYSLANSNGKIVFSIAGNIDTLYVNSEWTGLADGTRVAIPDGITAHIGVDALDKLASAKTLNPEEIKFAGGSYGDVIFGGSESENVEDVKANTNLTFLNGTFSKSVFAGNKIKTTGNFQALSEASVLDIQGGSYSAYVMGGDYLSTKQSSAAMVLTTGSRSVTISSGTFNGLVAGGSFIAGGTATLVSQFDGDIDVTISGGTFNKRIYGGDITDKLENSTTDIVDGNISFTLDASANDININENIVCGSYGYGTVKGNVVFTVKGSDNHLTFAAGSVVNGGSGNGYLKVSDQTTREFDNFVNGTSTAVFDGFSGEFTARLTLFDAISFDNDADVKLTNAKCNLAELSAWSFADGASVSFCYGQVNDFTGDTLDINLTDWDQTTPWTLAIGNEAAFSGFGAFEHVKFDGQEANYQNGCWATDDFALSLSDDRKSMLIARIS